MNSVLYFGILELNLLYLIKIYTNGIYSITMKSFPTKVDINTKELIQHFKACATAFFKWAVFGIIIGLICGTVGAGFAKSIEAVTALRTAQPWLIYLLPIGGIATVILYRLCRVSGMGITDVFESVRTAKAVHVTLAPAVFLSAVITHLLGGSAGKEGAALQLGSSIASLMGKIFKLGEKTRHILTMAGMGALFSAVFGTPLGAAIFALEVISVGHICSAAIFPCLVSSITSYCVSSFFGVHAERFNISAIPEMNFATVWKVAVIAICSAFVARAFCSALHHTEEIFAKLFKNEFLRITIGGVIIILLTLLVNTRDYNGGGIEIINRIFETGEVRYEAFLLKIIFTAITVGAGFKGGEIVPTLFIGATFGAAAATIIGLNPALGAAIGMSALFCSVTNCPITSIVLSIELFGTGSMVFCALAAATSFLLSGSTGLYAAQRRVFSKYTEERIRQK